MNTSNNREINGLVRVHYEHCDSTQTRTRSLVSKTEPTEGFVLSSDFQSQGKGQHGSKWNASKGMNLTMSMYLQPTQLKVEHQFLLNIWSSLALVKVLDQYLKDKNNNVKWPNDVLVNNRKIAGIIVQCSLQGNNIKDVILGIGVNVNESMKHYAFQATSIFDELNQRMPLGTFKENVIGEIQKSYKEGIQNKDFNLHKSAYEEKLWRNNKIVSFIDQGVKKTGRIKGINKTGELLIQTKGNLRTLRNKEVKFVLK